MCHRHPDHQARCVLEKQTGKERDQETGLDYFGARYYSGAQGRFTSADAPLTGQHPGDPQTWNLYSYGRNNPLKFTDPTGHDAVACGPDDTACVQRYTQAGNQGSELISGGVKGAINGLISTSNAINNVLDLAIGSTGLTDFRFGQTDLFPMTSTEQVGSVMTDVVVAAATAGESLFTSSNTTTGLTSVGRWMSTSELGTMQKTGMVQESLSGTTHVTWPPNPDAFKAAKSGSVFAEFNVPKGTVTATSEGSGKIAGPNSLEGRLAARKGLPVPQMPPATGIKVIARKP